MSFFCTRPPGPLAEDPPPRDLPGKLSCRATATPGSGLCHFTALAPRGFSQRTSLPRFSPATFLGERTVPRQATVFNQWSKGNNSYSTNDFVIFSPESSGAAQTTLLPGNPGRSILSEKTLCRRGTPPATFWRVPSRVARYTGVPGSYPATLGTTSLSLRRAGTCAGSKGRVPSRRGPPTPVRHSRGYLGRVPSRIARFTAPALSRQALGEFPLVSPASQPRHSPGKLWDSSLSYRPLRPGGTCGASEGTSSLS